MVCTLLRLRLSLLFPVLARAFYFDQYPVCAQPYLQETIPAACNFTADGKPITGSSSGADYLRGGKCFCPQISFLTNVSQTVYSHCGCDDLFFTAQNLTVECSLLSNIDWPYNTSQLVSFGDGGTLTCRDPATMDPSPSPKTSTLPLSTFSVTTLVTMSSASMVPTPLSGEDFKLNPQHALPLGLAIAVSLVVLIACIALVGVAYLLGRRARKRLNGRSVVAVQQNPKRRRRPMTKGQVKDAYEPCVTQTSID